MMCVYIGLGVRPVWEMASSIAVGKYLWTRATKRPLWFLVFAVIISACLRLCNRLPHFNNTLCTFHIKTETFLVTSKPVTDLLFSWCFRYTCCKCRYIQYCDHISFKNRIRECACLHAHINDNLLCLLQTFSGWLRLLPIYQYICSYWQILY